MHSKAPMPSADCYVHDGDKVQVGGTSLEMLYTPGHTPDHLAMYDGERVYTGDLLLIGGTGRTDFAGGDAGQSFDSITEKIFTLPESTVVLPGHDYRGNTASTVAEEKKSNPRLAGKTREDYIHIMSNLGLPLPEQIMEAIQINSAAFDDQAEDMPTYSQLAAVKQMDPSGLAGILGSPSERSKVMLLDVRTPEEFTGELGHIEGAMLMPVTDVAARASELEPVKDKTIVTVCRSGVRSTSAAAVLAGLGFPNTANLRGGMVAWREAGL